MSENPDNDSKFDVILTKSGGDKVEMMKVVMALTGWGLKQSKDLIDRPPGRVLKRVSENKANEAKSALEKAGARVEIKPSG